MERSWQETLDEIANKFSADIGAIHRYNPQDNHLYLVAFYGTIPEKILNMIKRTEMVGMVGETVKSRQTVTTHNLADAPPPSAGPGAAKTGVKGMVSVPILSSTNEMIGALGLGSFKERQFSDQEIKELTEIATSLAERLKTEKW